MPPALSVVIASLNRAADLERCLQALHAQTMRRDVQIIVIDDGSSDSTSDIAGAAGAVVVRHPVTRGVSAARNSGINIAAAEVVAFLDDDCEPLPDWAEHVILGYTDGVVALGGPIDAYSESKLLCHYLTRNNPLRPQEIELGVSSNILYRFLLYLRRQVVPVARRNRRPVHALASANLSVRRQALLKIGGFDERMRFGSEDYDLCWRLRRAFPTVSLIFDPSVVVIHHFKPSLTDMFRRSRAYGRSSALLHRKWPASVPPTFFPFPACTLATLILSIRFPLLLVVAALLPYLFYPRGFLQAIMRHRISPLLDPYLQLAQEACDNYGFIEGMWIYRSFSTADTFAEEPAEGGLAPD